MEDESHFVECSDCGRAWTGPPDSSCPFCEIERCKAEIKKLKDTIKMITFGYVPKN